jgi:hypothetical protein
MSEAGVQLVVIQERVTFVEAEFMFFLLYIS